MVEIMTVVIVVMLGCAISLMVVVLLRQRMTSPGQLQPCFDLLEKSVERTERAVREEIARSREESGAAAKQLRDEVNVSLKAGNDSLTKTLVGLSHEQRQQHESMGARQKARLEEFSIQLGKLIESNEKKFESLRTAVDERLKHIQEDNAKKLDQVRQTVDEKLQGTLEKRLGESFKLVSDRLEQVHKGLGEMQTLATGVGDLKRVLTNVKARGTWGEIQLASLLEQILSPDQYACNVCTRENSSVHVEFAIRLPGHSESSDEPVWLPIDSKFPQEDYHRLQEAHERADPELVESCSKELENVIKKAAKDIRDKYLNPPRTTDFGILFLPTEGLYAEVIRRPGLCDFLSRTYRINVTGPTTLCAFINSLQMGFRTLAIQKRSSEVWGLLGVVKTQFGVFGGILEKVQDKLQQASNNIELASKKARTIESKLRDVQELPVVDAQSLLLPEPELEEIAE